MAGSMASTEKLCRLCSETVKANRSYHLFGRSNSKYNWPSRITALLDIPVSDKDGCSPYVCQMCTRRIQSLENASADLKAFKDLAHSSLTHVQGRGPVKRTRVTTLLRQDLAQNWRERSSPFRVSYAN